MRYINTLAGAVALACCGSVSATDVTLEDFSNVEFLQINGDAAVVTTADGAVLRLTKAQEYQAGSVFSKTKVSTAKFSTFFQFRMTQPGGMGADGLVFVVQPVSSSAGSDGGGLGYENIPTSIGVEFDTYYNSDKNDPDANHVGININGRFNGATKTVRTPFQNGALWSVWVDYDGSQLEVRANTTTTGERPDSPLLTRVLNISTVLGGISEAYIGFTAATGESYENHDIITWSFRDQYQPIEGKPSEGNETKLLATGVELTATKNGSGVDLTLTTTAEPDTAELLILRGDKLDNGGTKIDVACDFLSGGSPYTCTDDVVANTYRAAEIDYDGSLIIYDEVTPK
ncbi:MAG: L-type lectin-domain containing protein [Candidatus Parabeggiatoa sp.]|nr:L-type lectin-domain containing protein [Candidatus Parabeggiatoa sp.]